MTKSRSKPAVRRMSIYDSDGTHTDYIQSVFHAAKRKTGQSMIFTMHAAFALYAKKEGLDVGKEGDR